MSEKKETKIFEPSDIDSGCFSGPIDELPGDEKTSGEPESVKSDKKKVPCDSEVCKYDSGVISGPMSEEDLIDCKTETAEAPSEVTHHELPPLRVLFEQDDDGDTQLHIAAVHGCEKAVGTLITVCPNKEWFNIPNDYGQTALHLAAMSGNAVVTRMLVIAGASLAVRDRRGETPLHKATILCSVDCIHALLQPVKEHPQRRLSHVLNQKNYNGKACVHLAAAAGHIETLQALVFYGADINCRENLAGWTALHIAAQRGDARLAQHLRERCAGVEARARDFGGRTPRRLAKRNQAARAFVTMVDDSDSDTETDDDMYDSDNERLFETLSAGVSLIDVA